jgi:hypothetical protein
MAAKLKFGSPEWRAKYGMTGKAKASATKAVKKKAAPKKDATLERLMGNVGKAKAALAAHKAAKK